MSEQPDVLPIHPDRPPLRTDPGGIVRIGRTRVSLDVVVEAYMDGESAEGIVDSYDSLTLAEAYATIAYYLNHREEVDAYVTRRRLNAERQRAEHEATHPPPTRAALLARQAAREQLYATARH